MAQEMIRELAGHQLVPPEKNFRWRGGEITRLEGFTDAVFALPSRCWRIHINRTTNSGLRFNTCVCGATITARIDVMVYQTWMSMVKQWRRQKTLHRHD